MTRLWTIGARVARALTRVLRYVNSMVDKPR